MATGIASKSSQNKTVSGDAYSVFTAAKRCMGYRSECNQRHLIWLAVIFLVTLVLFMLLANTIDELHCSRLEPRLPRFLVDSASFSKLNFTASNLTAYGLVSLRVINPNPNHTISYDQLQAVLYYGGESRQPLDVARAPPFYQDRLGETIIGFQFELVNEYVGEEVVRGRLSDARARGYVDFGVWVKAWSDFEPDEKPKQGQKMWHCHSSIPNLEIHCNPVTFGLSSHNDTGSMLIPSSECVVHDYEDPKMIFPGN